MSFLTPVIDQENERRQREEGLPPIDLEKWLQTSPMASVFEEHEVSQVEADQLAVVALNLRNLPLFQTCVDHGAQLVNHPLLISFPEISDHHQHYHHNTFSHKNSFQAFLSNHGPYFDSIPGTSQLSLFQKDEHLFLSTWKDSHHIREKALLRELFPLDTEQKKDHLIRFLNSHLGEPFYHQCSSHFSQKLLYELALPNGALESLSYESNESIERSKNEPSLEILSAEMHEFKAKAQHAVFSMLKNHAQPEPIGDFLNPWGYGEAAYEHWVEKNVFLAHCLFNPHTLPGMNKLLGDHHDQPCYAFPEYSAMVFDEQPRLYFILTALENCLGIFNRFSDEQQCELNDEHPFMEHAENLTIELFKKDRFPSFAPLIMSENGIWESLVRSPLFSSHHVLSAVIEWSTKASFTKKDEETSYVKFMRIAETELKQRNDLDLQRILDTYDLEDISSNLFLNVIQKTCLSKSIKATPVKNRSPVEPSFRF